MSGLDKTERDDVRRDDAARLVAVAINMLNEDREQIVRDYLSHALAALERVRETDLVAASSK